MTSFIQSSTRRMIVATLAMFAFLPTVSAQNVDNAAVTTITQQTKLITFNLGPGGITLPVKVPTNKPVQIVGITTTVGFRGVGQASLLHTPAPTEFIEWVGLDSTSGAAITEGFSSAPGTKILYIDFSHQVIVEVAGPGTIQIHNNSTGVRAGKVTMTW